MTPHRSTAADRARFEAKVDRRPGYGPDGDCHIWTAHINKRTGYGRFKLGKVGLAHRAAWVMEHGYWPDLCVLHRCDNRACVNPDHLFLGTVADNNADMDAKGRANRVGFRVINRGETHPTAKLTQAEVDAIRASDESHAALGRRYGVANTTIFKIRRGLRWRPEEGSAA